MVEVLSRLQLLMEKIANAEIDASIAAMTALMLEKPSADSAQTLEIAMIVWIVSWLISIADSYRIGRRFDKLAQRK